MKSTTWKISHPTYQFERVHVMKENFEAIFAHDSKLKLTQLKIELKSAIAESKCNVNSEIIIRYLDKIREKEKLFESAWENPKGIKALDISKLERDIVFLLQDIVFMKRDYNGLYASLKRIFWEKNYLLIIYLSESMMSYESECLKRTIFIGVPFGVVLQSDLFVLVLHEIGHSLLDKSDFLLFNKKIGIEIDRLQESISRPTVIDRPNENFSRRLYFCETVVKNQWLTEIASDIFGTYISGHNYLQAFVLYQLNSSYYDPNSDHPPNSIRFLYIYNYLKRIRLDHRKDSALSNSINDNRSDDHNPSFIMEQDYLKALFKDFDKIVERNLLFGFLKEKIAQIITQTNE